MNQNIAANNTAVATSAPLDKKQVTRRKSSVLDIVRLSEVETRAVEWLWEPYIPFGKITMLEGDPETGKTFVALEIAAKVTRGEPLPINGIDIGGSILEPANVLYLSAEDDLADTIRPRLEKAKGDLSRFFALQGIIHRADTGDDTHGSITLSDIPLLESALLEYKPRLIVVDPFQAFLGARVDMHRANEVRPVLTEIGKLASRHKCAFLMIRHLTKALHRKSILCGIGSIDINAAARSVLIAASAESREDFVLTHAKCSNAKKGPSLSYCVTDGGLKWNGTSELSAMDFLTGKSAVKKPVQDAEKFVREFLSGRDSCPAEDLIAAAEANGISNRTLLRARRNLGVQTRPAGYQKHWEVFLPSDAEDSADRSTEEGE